MGKYYESMQIGTTTPNQSGPEGNDNKLLFSYSPTAALGESYMFSVIPRKHIFVGDDVLISLQELQMVFS